MKRVRSKSEPVIRSKSEPVICPNSLVDITFRNILEHNPEYKRILKEELKEELFCELNINCIPSLVEEIKTMKTKHSSMNLYDIKEYLKNQYKFIDHEIISIAIDSYESAI